VGGSLLQSWRLDFAYENMKKAKSLTDNKKGSDCFK
jgi:hypothetical protein